MGAAGEGDLEEALALVAAVEAHAAVEREGGDAHADDERARGDGERAEQRRDEQLGGEDGAAHDAPLHGRGRLVAELAAEHGQLRVVVAEELEAPQLVAAPVAEVRLAARAVHVVAARRPLDKDLRGGAPVTRTSRSTRRRRG